MSAYAEYHASAHKLLSDNRAVYIAMSALTRDGKRPTYSEAEQYAIEQMRDHPSADEVAAGFQLKYGVAHDAG